MPVREQMWQEQIWKRPTASRFPNRRRSWMEKWTSDPISTTTDPRRGGPYRPVRRTKANRGPHALQESEAALGKKNEDRLPIQQPLAQFAESVVTAVATTAPERQRVQCGGCKGGAERLFKEYISSRDWRDTVASV